MKELPAKELPTLIPEERLNAYHLLTLSCYERGG